MDDKRAAGERASHPFPRVSTREVTDEILAPEILEYVDRHPGAGEWEMAQALRVPLRQVYDVTRALEKRGELSRGESESAGA